MSAGSGSLALTEEQRAELLRAIRSARTARLYRRLKIVELASRGRAVEELSALFDVSARSVQHYLERYRRGGVDALPDAPRSGRPRKLPPEYDRGPASRGTWQRLLDRRPSTIPELGTPAHVWTLALLARYLRLFHGALVAESTIYNVLSRAGFRRGRTKLTVTSPDPDYESKRRRIEALGKAPAPAS
jgi:transposase